MEVVRGGGLPPYKDIKGWKAIEDKAGALRPFYTGQSNQLNWHPRHARIRTVFTDELHDYYVDDVLVRWPSPSRFMHWLWPPFPEKEASERSAIAQLKGLLSTFVTKSDAPPNASLSTLTSIFSKDIGVRGDAEKTLTLFWDRLRALFTSSAGELVSLVDLEHTDTEFASKLVALLAKEIRGQWNDNRNRGSSKHVSYDAACQQAEPPPGKIPPPLGFWRVLCKLLVKYDIWGSEIELFDEVAQVVGCADLVLVDRQTGELILADFKNCKDADLAKGGDPNSTGTHPFTKTMSGSKLSHYRFQLSFYRDVFNRLYWPGRFSKRMLLLNFRPDYPDGFYEYWMDCLDMKPFFDLLPWKKDDPRHVLPLADTLVPRFPDSDPRCIGPTTRIAKPRDVSVLPGDVVWSGKAYTKFPPPLPASPWANPIYHFGDPGPEVAPTYETYLLGNRDLLARLPEVIGKKVACWCKTEETKCSADVIVKYANLYHHGAFTLPALPPKSEFFKLNMATSRKRKIEQVKAVDEGNVARFAEEDDF